MGAAGWAHRRRRCGRCGSRTAASGGGAAPWRVRARCQAGPGSHRTTKEQEFPSLNGHAQNSTHPWPRWAAFASPSSDPARQFASRLRRPMRLWSPLVGQELPVHDHDDTVAAGIGLAPDIEAEVDRAHDAIAELLVNELFDRRARRPGVPHRTGRSWGLWAPRSPARPGWAEAAGPAGHPRRDRAVSRPPWPARPSSAAGPALRTWPRPRAAPRPRRAGPRSRPAGPWRPGRTPPLPSCSASFLPPSPHARRQSLTRMPARA